MMKAAKIKFIIALLITIIVITGISSYLTVKKILPTVLSANLEEILAKETAQPVAIGRTSMKLFPGFAIKLIDVEIGTPAKPLVRAHKVEARLSLWHAIFGRIKISRLKLDKPLIYLDYEALKRLKLQQEKGISPSIYIYNGTVRMSDKERRIVMEGINGVIHPDETRLKATILGGKARLLASRNGGWKGVFTSSDMDLSRLGIGLKGTCSIEENFSVTSDNQILSTFQIVGEHVFLPWSQNEIETVQATLDAQGNEKVLLLKEISVTTPFVTINGSGQLGDPLKGRGATVMLDLKSGIFEYEKVVPFLPVKDFDPWLAKLLTTQVSGGRSRFPVARYQGTVDELIHFTRFIDHIYVLEDIIGQSFGYGPGKERVGNITGQVFYGQGDILIKNLHGVINGSPIEKVEISFPKILSKYWTIGVNVSLDLPARDFLDTWNAAGLPDYAINLFSDISQVKKGRVKGAASFFWDEEKGKPMQVMGSASLTDCAYQWGSQQVTGNYASIVSKTYDSPLEISSTLNLGDRRIKSFNLLLVEPFRALRSSFDISMEGFISESNIRMGKETTIHIRGTGTELDISAEADISSDKLTLFDTAYKKKAGPIRARVNLKGKLAPKLALALNGQVEALTPGRLSISGNLGDQLSRIQLKGLLDLSQFEIAQPEYAQKLSGSIRGDVNINWGKAGETSVEGSLVCRHSALPFKGSLITLDGPVRLSGSTLWSRILRVSRDDLKIKLSDWSFKAADKPVFKGNAVVSGLSLPLSGKETGKIEGLESYSAQGHLKIVDMDFYGIPVENTDADALLKNGIVHLSDIRMQGTSVSGQGTLSANSSGIIDFDTSFSFKNVSITKFLGSFSSSQDWIRGNMSMEGRLFGKRDSINGSVSLLAKDGKLKKYALFSRIFALLNVYKIIQSRDIELTTKNFPYNTISSTFNIKDSIVQFNDFYLDSNSLQFSAVGKYSLKTSELDAILGVQPFETIDRAIHAIPLVGWILTGDKARLFVISMTVKGNIDDPLVKFAPIDTVSAPVKKSLIRAFRLPGAIMEKSRYLLPDNRKKKGEETGIESPVEKK